MLILIKLRLKLFSCVKKINFFFKPLNSLFGLVLAFYATPSTDAALTALPDNQVGSGSGIYKMASSLGASFGVAISATVLTMYSNSPESIQWIEGVFTFMGRQDNTAVREAAFFAFGVNLLMAVAALFSITLTIPKKLKLIN